MSPASLGARVVAMVVDFVVLGTITVVLILLFNGGVGWLLGQFVTVGYYVYFEGGPSGQSPGKRLLEIRVVDVHTGGSIGHGHALVRMIMRFVSGLVFGLGYLWVLWDKRRQTWHDKAASALVVPARSEL